MFDPRLYRFILHILYTDFGNLRNMALEKIEWSAKVSNEQVLQRLGERRTLLNNVLRIKANWTGHILRINCLLHDTNEGLMTKVKKVG